METINDLLSESLGEFIQRIVDFIPNVLVMFVIILSGIVLAAVVRFLFLWGLSLIRFDSMAEKTGVSQVLVKGGITTSPSRMFASILHWGIMLVFLMTGFIALDIVPINNLISDFFSYLPSIIAASVIIIVGLMFSSFIERAVSVTVINAGISHGELIGKGAKLLMIAMATSMALDQLGIARGIIVAAFSISFGGVVLALSLAFGLGAQNLAREFLEKRLRKDKGKED